MLDKFGLNTGMTTIAIILALIIWSYTAFQTGYIWRRLNEEIEHAEVRARIWEALMKKESNDTETQ